MKAFTSSIRSVMLRLTRKIKQLVYSSISIRIVLLVLQVDDSDFKEKRKM